MIPDDVLLALNLQILPMKDVIEFLKETTWIERILIAISCGLLSLMFFGAIARVATERMGRDIKAGRVIERKSEVRNDMVVFRVVIEGPGKDGVTGQRVVIVPPAMWEKLPVGTQFTP